ncbi:hypothetical protein FOZ60_016844 [Perkinsus olseni]|nr:hypothetical protein FOZ60_016844 [Perkinsus olseni]
MVHTAAASASSGMLYDPRRPFSSTMDNNRINNNNDSKKKNTPASSYGSLSSQYACIMMQDGGMSGNVRRKRSSSSSSSSSSSLNGIIKHNVQDYVSQLEYEIGLANAEIRRLKNEAEEREKIINLLMDEIYTARDDLRNRRDKEEWIVNHHRIVSKAQEEEIAILREDNPNLRRQLEECRIKLMNMEEKYNTLLHHNCSNDNNSDHHPTIINKEMVNNA